MLAFTALVWQKSSQGLTYRQAQKRTTGCRIRKSRQSRKLKLLVCSHVGGDQHVANNNSPSIKQEASLVHSGGSGARLRGGGCRLNLARWGIKGSSDPGAAVHWFAQLSCSTFFGIQFSWHQKYSLNQFLSKPGLCTGALQA